MSWHVLQDKCCGDDGVATHAYDDAGNVIAVTDAEGHTTRFEYDAMNRRTAVVDATGYRTETIYNLRGVELPLQSRTRTPA